jgi:hypothetical protein
LERQEIGVRAVRGELRMERLVPRRVIVDQHAAGSGIDLDPPDARYRCERLPDLLEHARLAFRAGHLDAHPARNVVADMGLMRHERLSSGLAGLGPPDPGDRQVTQGVGRRQGFWSKTHGSQSRRTLRIFLTHGVH